MGRIKGWKKAINEKNNEVYVTTSQLGEGENSLPVQTVQIFGDKDVGNLHILEAVPSPEQGHYINKFISKFDTLTGLEFDSFDDAKVYALSYMTAFSYIKENPHGIGK